MAGPERVAAAAVCDAKAFGLEERMDGEPPRALEPALVAGARERFQERETVAGRAMAEAVTLLVAVRAGSPDQLGRFEEQLLVEVVPRAGGDAGRAGAPLEADEALRVGELGTRRTGPVCEAVLTQGGTGEHLRHVGRKRVVPLEPEQ